MRTIPFIALLLAAAPAAAQKTASIEVMVVQASPAEGPTDPKLEGLKERFGEFRYRSFRLLSQSRVDVAEGGSQTVALPENRKLTVSVPKLPGGQKALLRLSVPGVIEQSEMTVREGETVTVGGPALKHGDGVLFLPVKLVRAGK